MPADVRNLVNTTVFIVVGIIAIGITMGIGLQIVNSLDSASNGSLATVVQQVTSALAPVGSVMNFLGLLAIVMVAVALIAVLLERLGGVGAGA